MGIIDANILIRYYTRDVPDQAAQARALIEQVDRGLEIAVNEVVIAEVIHVLGSKKLYGFSRIDIKDYLLTFLNLRGVVLPNRSIVTRALILYATANLDFADALLASSVESGKYEHVISFDERISKVPGVKVKQPEVM